MIVFTLSYIVDDEIDFIMANKINKVISSTSAASLST